MMTTADPQKQRQIDGFLVPLGPRKETVMDVNAAIIHLQGKSLGLGVVLTILFGGLGMFYLSIGWGLIGLFVEAILWVVTFITFGIFVFFVAGWHIICVIITVVSINSHNRRLLNSLS